MKKQILNFGKTIKNVFVITLLFTLTQSAFGQKNNISSTSILRGKSSLTYERAINTTSSARIGLKFFTPSFINNNFSNEGIRLAGEYRFYLTKQSKSLNGFYIAPNISIGKHSIRYQYTQSSGIGLGLIFAIIDVVGDGDLDHTPHIRTPEIITGNANVTATSIGLKMGVQKTWRFLSFDTGINLSKNSVFLLAA